MSWPQIHEDDGLDPIEGPVSHVQPSSPYATLPYAEPSSAPGQPSGTAPGMGPGPKRAQEPTLILRERQVDSIRAQVQRRRRSAQVRKHVGTLLWVAAGGFAVLLGAFLARGVRALWEPEASVSDTTAASLHEVSPPPVALIASAPQPSRPSERAETARPSVSNEKTESQATASRRSRSTALRLDEIPTE